MRVTFLETPEEAMPTIHNPRPVVDPPINVPDYDCIYCGAHDDCDCAERNYCEQAGEPGHLQCGVWPCNHPCFMHAEGQCWESPDA